MSITSIIASIKTKAAVLAATALFGSTIVVPALAPHAAAAVNNPAPLAKVSFTFDDSLTSTYSQAAPTLAKYGLTGTDYVITGCVGMTKKNNKCRANPDTTYMTWAQIQALQNTYGWELGSHTVDHECLASSVAQDPDDCQANTLTKAQVDAELANSKAALAANGVTATDFAPPYGDYNNLVLAEAAKYYATMRQFKNAAGTANVWPYSDYFLQNFPVQETTDTVATVESAINTAIANKTWLILTFHDIKAKPSTNPDDYEYGTTELQQLAAYVQSKQTAGMIQSAHISQALVTSDANLLPNASFSDGISDGWTTDNSAAISGDGGNNGSYPDPVYSVHLTGGASGLAHLFSPQVAVDPNTTYMLKNFLNTAASTSGQVGFYIDEYNAQGQWISGQYKATEPGAFVEDMNFSYKPSSALVARASLQVIASGTGVSAYLDSVQLFALSSVAAPVQTNLMPNATFDAGLSGDWTTDDAARITADGGSHGAPSDPINSIKMVAAPSANNHLFSPKIAVSNAHQYEIIPYLNLASLSGGGVAFYIDEYNASGQWISGQYKFEVSSVGAGDQPIGYTPSSSAVATASLQVIVVGGSGVTAYVDDVRWYQL